MSGGDTFESVTCTTVVPVVQGFVLVGGKHGLLALGTNELCQVKIEKWTLGIECKNSISSVHVRFELVPIAYDHACREDARCGRWVPPCPSARGPSYCNASSFPIGECIMFDINE